MIGRTFEKEIEIAGYKIGRGQPPFIIAEISANHNQSLKRALKIVDEAAAAGVHAVKLQTYTADTMTLDIKEGEFYISDSNSLWKGKSLYELYQEAYTPWEWHEPIFNRARDLGLVAFSTPFDETAVDFLESLDNPIYKIASFELVDFPLIKKIAAIGKPLIMSTGMANLEEITEAVEAARNGGCEDIILLHCISAYPAPVDQCNLKTIPDLARRFDVISGLSDHSLGTTVSLAGVAQGACVIEKHVTLNRGEKGPDSEFSLEPIELKRLCEDSRVVWTALGKAGYECRTVEENSIKFRRSVYMVKDIKAGDILTSEHIRVIRPGYGLPPKYLHDLIGKRVSRSAKFGEAVGWELFS
ncbi:MAG: pseudaminic acid synthase [Bacteroidetes bacterium]|nr:pseudaminic acid synthase [Bacteroidota bacterium]